MINHTHTNSLTMSKDTKDTTSRLIPTAQYTSPDLTKDFTPGDGPHTTNGKTTGPSDYVLNAGQVDKDASTESLGTNLGQLRAELTTIQDKVNIFLTERMKEAAASGNDDNSRNVDIDQLVAGGDEEEDDE